ncbi:hypothetical protein DW083_12515 [Parabacteroides sp. AF48-14]|uniref:DUF6383 domain-containing protein n=1 Tax=Parabacteroides sp. AF48-14 TaxID=2292052 RepID=UPI000FF65E70|nr:DUF6383 domain-containing protein [Parabacteroides sp. AF48-14]RHO70899.1 hypothetical protein DW083_12515 [Parabacteroides sp. AF48-14]
MNKKFSTLLAAFAMVGASVSAQTITEAVAEADSIVSGEYYYLGTAAPAGGLKALTIVKTSANKDSLVLKTIGNDATAAALGDSALWSVSTGSTVALGDYFTFTNVLTSKTLKLDKKGNAILSSDAAAIDKFGWTWEKGTAKGLTHIAGGKTYTLVANNTAGGTADSLSLSEGTTTTVSLMPLVPAWKALTVAELNGINGSHFTWTVDGATSTTTQAVNSVNAFKTTFKAVGYNSADADTTVYLQKLGSLVGSKAAYLNVDTVYYTKTGALIDSTKANGGLVFTLDTLDGATPKAGKIAESFQFKVWKNVKDSIIVEVINIPTAAANTTFAETSTITSGFVTLVGFDGTSKALTASAPSTANVLPTVTLGAGTKVTLPAGAYYIYKQDGDSAYVSTLATTLAAATNVKVKAGYEKAWLPSSQWSLASTTDRPAFVNRESGKAFGTVAALYSSDEDGVYYYGGDTLKIVPVATEGIYVGYKKMGETAAEEAVTKLALQFHSVLTEGSTPFVREAANDSILEVANMDKADALYFNVIPVDTFSIGADSLVAVAYKLYNGTDTLAYDATRKAYKLSTSDDDDYFVFRETTTEGWYQVLPIASVTTGAWTLEGQVSASGTSAEVVLNTDLNLINGYFSLEAPLAPEYATIEGAPGHKRISSVENPTLAISMNSDSCGVLKAVTELKAAFEQENFSMYLDVYDNDTIKPLYMISTQQTVAMDSAEYVNDVRFFMNAAANDSLGFRKAKRIGAELDSLHVYDVPANQDTVIPANVKKNYTFAFRKSATDSEYYIESQGTPLKYMAQTNGILHLVNGTDNALLFSVDKADMPTANEATPSVSEVTVIAGNGNVQIAGAAGKKVVVSNILGQVIANTVITSDNATIAAPAGVVVVAVEGEEAVKAIVK